MNEILRADEWLYNRLHGDSTLAGMAAIVGYLAKDGTPFPRVTFNFQGGADASAIGAIRIMLSGLWQVKATVQSTSYAPAKPIADRIDALLHGAEGSVGDGLILGCVREQPIAYVETDSGLQYRHIGGLYRIIIQGV